MQLSAVGLAYGIFVIGLFVIGLISGIFTHQYFIVYGHPQHLDQFHNIHITAIMNVTTTTVTIVTITVTTIYELLPGLPTA